MHAAAVFSIFQIVGISVGTQRRAQLVFDLKYLAPKTAQPRQNDGGQHEQEDIPADHACRRYEHGLAVEPRIDHRGQNPYREQNQRGGHHEIAHDIADKKEYVADELRQPEQ